MTGQLLEIYSKNRDYNDPSKGYDHFFYYKDHIHGYITQEIIDKYKELYESNKENKLEDNKKVYLTPLSNYPSHKLKNYIEENNLNIKLTRKISELNTFIINHDFITESYCNSFNHYYMIPADVILNNPIFDKFKKCPITYISSNLRKNIEYFFIDLCKYDKFLKIDSNFSIIKQYPIINCYLVTPRWGESKAYKHVDFFLNLDKTVKQYNLNLIFDSNIDKTINQDLVIDEDIFENIFNMIISKDKSNINIAKGILSNLDFESSKPYLIYLFNYFYFLKQSSDDTNIKYLLKNMKKYTHTHFTKNYEANFEELLPILVNKYPNYTQIFMNCFRIHINILLKHPAIEEIKTY